MSGHADLAPSAAHRWIRCPGSVPMSKGIGDTGSSYAAEGTWAHKLAEVRLEGRETLTEGEIADLVGLTGETYDTAAMAEPVRYYVDYVKSLGGDLFTEQRLSLAEITGEEGARGTADAVILRGSELVIADLKFGQGVKVDAVKNPQLTIYAGAAVRTFAPMMDEELAQIRLIIIQPRLDHVSEWTLTPAELEARLDAISKAAAEARREMTAEDTTEWHLCPGLPQCRFCPARGRCRELARFALTAAGLEELKGTVPKLDTNMIGETLGKLDLIQSWIDGMRQVAEEELLKGHRIPGWKLVAGRAGPRKWGDKAAADRALAEKGVPDSLRFVRELISPTQAEKLVKEGKITDEQWQAVQGEITRSEPKPAVVPESDPREPWTPLTAADFPDESGGTTPAPAPEKKSSKGKKTAKSQHRYREVK